MHMSLKFSADRIGALEETSVEDFGMTDHIESIEFITKNLDRFQNDPQKYEELVTRLWRAGRQVNWRAVDNIFNNPPQIKRAYEGMEASAQIIQPTFAKLSGHAEQCKAQILRRAAVLRQAYERFLQTQPVAAQE
jgi:hypothetical protein